MNFEGNSVVVSMLESRRRAREHIRAPRRAFNEKLIINDETVTPKGVTHIRDFVRHWWVNCKDAKDAEARQTRGKKKVYVAPHSRENGNRIQDTLKEVDVFIPFGNNRGENMDKLHDRYPYGAHYVKDGIVLTIPGGSSMCMYKTFAYETRWNSMNDSVATIYMGFENEFQLTIRGTGAVYFRAFD